MRSAWIPQRPVRCPWIDFIPGPAAPRLVVLLLLVIRMWHRVVLAPNLGDVSQ